MEVERERGSEGKRREEQRKGQTREPGSELARLARARRLREGLAAETVAARIGSEGAQATGKQTGALLLLPALEDACEQPGRGVTQ